MTTSDEYLKKSYDEKRDILLSSSSKDDYIVACGRVYWDSQFYIEVVNRRDDEAIRKVVEYHGLSWYSRNNGAKVIENGDTYVFDMFPSEEFYSVEIKNVSSVETLYSLTSSILNGRHISEISINFNTLPKLTKDDTEGLMYAVSRSLPTKLDIAFSEDVDIQFPLLLNVLTTPNLSLETLVIEGGINDEYITKLYEVIGDIDDKSLVTSLTIESSAITSASFDAFLNLLKKDVVEYIDITAMRRYDSNRGGDYPPYEWNQKILDILESTSHRHIINIYSYGEDEQPGDATDGSDDAMEKLMENGVSWWDAISKTGEDMMFLDETKYPYYAQALRILGEVYMNEKYEIIGE